MRQNVGSWDAMVRLVLAAMCFGLSILTNDSPATALFFAFIGLVLACTAVTRSCPLYGVLGASTTHRQRHRPRN